MPLPRIVPPAMIRRAQRFVRLLGAPKTRRVLRLVLVVASIYTLLTFFLGSHIDHGDAPITHSRRLRETAASTVRRITSYARGQQQSPAPRRRIRGRYDKLKAENGGLPATGKHKYQQNGLVEVNPMGAHPIYELMERAEKQWKRKQARASRTLEQAVREYKRRYKRNPPKGFDVWCVQSIWCKSACLSRIGGTLCKSTTSSFPTNTTRFTGTTNICGAYTLPISSQCKSKRKTNTPTTGSR